MTQGQFRAAAAQARVSTIPDDSTGAAYMTMAVRKGSDLESAPPAALAMGGTNRAIIPLATSSPSGIPRLICSRNTDR